MSEPVTSPGEPAAGTPEHWAKQTPQAPAVVDGDRTLTYADWDDLSGRVAEGLARQGLGAGDRLGLRFRLRIEWFVVQRALQKLGVSQVSVNWRLTAPEVAHILADSGARGIACDDADPSGLVAAGPEFLITVGQPPGPPGLRYEDLARTGLGTGPAARRSGSLRALQILYTSGTTGAPRGVQFPDTVADPERLRRWLTAVDGVPPRGPQVVSLQTLPVHHGAGVRDLTRVAALGGTVVLLDPFDPVGALRLIEAHRVDVWTCVPTMLQRIRQLPEEVRRSFDVSSLRYVGVGAAPSVRPRSWSTTPGGSSPAE